MKQIFKLINNTIKCAIEQERTQSKLKFLIGKQKKTDSIKVKMPKKYFLMIELIAMYGIEDSIHLKNIFDKHIANSKTHKHA